MVEDSFHHFPKASLQVKPPSSFTLPQMIWFPDLGVHSHWNYVQNFGIVWSVFNSHFPPRFKHCLPVGPDNHSQHSGSDAHPLPHQARCGKTESLTGPPFYQFGICFLLHRGTQQPWGPGARCKGKATFVLLASSLHYGFFVYFITSSCLFEDDQG